MRRCMHARGVPRPIKMSRPPQRKRARSVSLDPLFFLPLTAADTVRVGAERVWAPGLLVYMSLHGTAWDGTTDLGAEHWNAARDNLAQFGDEHAARGLALPLLASFVSASPPSMHGAAGMQLEPQQVFWLGLLDRLHARLVELVKLDADSGTAAIVDVLALIHTGIQFLCVHNPVLAKTLLSSEETRLTECLQDECFYRFNPVHLVATILWTQMLRDAVYDLLETFHTSLQDPAFVSHSLPCPFLPLVNESEVADPADARRIVDSQGMPPLVSPSEAETEVDHAEAEGQFEPEFGMFESAAIGLLGLEMLRINFEALTPPIPTLDGRL